MEFFFTGIIKISVLIKLRGNCVIECNKEQVIMSKQRNEKIKIKSKLFDYEHENPSTNGWKIIRAFLIAAVLLGALWICRHA
jgi:hypothetical protein